MFGAIYLPDFSLQAVLRQEPQLRALPVALVDDDSPKSPITQVTSAASQQGATPGITSTQAKARCEKIAFRLRSVPQENAAQEILLECAYSAAAYIESTGPGICTLDLRGLPLTQVANRVEALQHWAAQILARLEDFHLTGRVGIASTPALALQATHTCEPVKLIENVPAFWNELRIDRLTTSPELLDVLRKWGIATVSAFLALGKDKIAERLGADGIHLFETACADKIRPLNLTTPRQIYEEFFEFENPVETLEPLLFMARRFLDQLARRVGLASLVIRDIAICLRLESGAPHERTLKIPAPTRDLEVLFRILHNYLETVRTQSPITAIALRAEPCPAEARQFQLFETAVRDPNRFYETMGRLNALLGPDRVGIPVRRDSFRPDDFSIEPISASSAGPLQKQTVFTSPVARGLLLRRFRPPMPASVKLHEGQPASIRNDRFNAAIVCSSGPFRLSGEWWEKAWSREEWDVQTKHGDLLRLIRENHDWFLEGAYD